MSIATKYTGKYFDDFAVGDVFETPIRRVSKEDVYQFAQLTGDFNPLHMDEEFARRSIFGQQIAHGMLTTSLTVGLVSELGIFYGTVIAFVECSVKFLAPVYFGDTLRVEATVTGKIDSGKPNRGSVAFRGRTFNQENILVAETGWTLLMKKRKV